MNEENENSRLKKEKKEASEKGNMFHELVVKECEVEITILNNALERAVSFEATDDICKLTESLTRIKQNAMLVAANAQAILIKVINEGNKSKQIGPESLAKKFINEARKEVVSKQ